MDLMNNMKKSSFIKKTKFQEIIGENVRCLTCERRCIIPEGAIGYCGTRMNINGEIFSIVYGCLPAISVNAIEKKPLYHFHPNTKAITIGTYGCNFDCFWCQNHHISHPEKPIKQIVKEHSNYIPPEEVLNMGLEQNCEGTSISFNEPTLLFEYSLKLFKLARKRGLYNTYVTNGYMTVSALRELAKAGLNAMNFDIKGDPKFVKKYCNADLEKIWRNARIANELGIHLELTTLLIGNLNSSLETIKYICTKIKEELGRKTPLHLSRFFPHYKAIEMGYQSPTSKSILEKCYQRAKNFGIEHVYLGNLYEKKYIHHTRCPNCNKVVIKRDMRGIQKVLVKKSGECPFCQSKINMII